MYKTLQLSVERKEGFGNDQNAIVLRMLADSLEAVEQYGKPQNPHPPKATPSSCFVAPFLSCFSTSSLIVLPCVSQQ